MPTVEFYLLFAVIFMLSENNAQLSSKSHLSEAGRPGRLAYTLALISRSQLPMNIFSAANIFTRQKVFFIRVNHFLSTCWEMTRRQSEHLTTVNYRSLFKCGFVTIGKQIYIKYYGFSSIIKCILRRGSNVTADETTRRCDALLVKRKFWV